MSARSYFVHASSLVEEPCSIGPGTRIWHFCHVMAGATIGRDCSLGQNVFVAAGARIGDRCKIQNNVSLYAGVVLEDDVFCGPSLVFTNVTSPRSEVSRRDQYEATIVKRGATLGANATILCGISIGAYAFVGAGAVVTRDVPGFALVTGNPARQRGFMCVCGAKLAPAGDSKRCRVCGARYWVEGDGLRAAAGSLKKTNRRPAAGRP